MLLSCCYVTGLSGLSIHIVSRLLRLVCGWWISGTLKSRSLKALTCRPCQHHQCSGHGINAVMVLLQVPEQIFITDKLPKGATGKISRRNMPAAFLGGKAKKRSGGGAAKQPTQDKDSGKPLIYSKL